MEHILFHNNVFPWTELKYNKRVTRLIVLYICKFLKYPNVNLDTLKTEHTEINDFIGKIYNISLFTITNGKKYFVIY